MPVQEGRIESWGNGVLDEFGVATSFDMQNPLVKDYLADFRDVTLVGTNALTQTAVRDTLLEGVQAGEGIDDLKARIRLVFADAEGYRAERIARTEVVTASNGANVAAYQISGVVDEKEWLATRDSQTRETHKEMDGQAVGILGNFVSPSGDTAQHPGGFSSAEENINCRCTVLPKLKDEEKAAADKDALWKAYDAALLPWESALLKALGKAFSEQRDEVLRRLDNA